MDRSRSEDHIAFGPVTPWEKTTFNRQPLRGALEPCHPGRERPRPARENSVKTGGPPKRSATPRSDLSRRGTPGPDDKTRQHRVQESLSAQATPRPYETAFPVPQLTPGAPSPPPCYTRALPATPPESFSEKSISSTDKSSSPTSKPIVHVLPGTMAARHARSRASSRQRSDRQKTKPTKAHRWKVVFREIFTKKPVDETMFEKIEDRHWTDE